MVGPSRITPGCDCARCALHELVDRHYSGDHLRDSATGLVTVDVAAMAADFGTVLGAMIQAVPDRGARRRAVRFAKDCIDAGVAAARDGTLVAVESAREH